MDTHLVEYTSTSSRERDEIVITLLVISTAAGTVVARCPPRVLLLLFDRTKHRLTLSPETSLQKDYYSTNFHHRDPKPQHHSSHTALPYLSSITFESSVIPSRRAIKLYRRLLVRQVDRGIFNQDFVIRK